MTEQQPEKELMLGHIKWGLHLLENEVLAWVWVRHGPHLGHNYPVCSHVGFVGVASEESAPVDHFTYEQKNICKESFFFQKLIFAQITGSEAANNISSLFPHQFQVRDETPTIFEVKAVHDGHPIEPVLVAGITHRKQAGAIADQSALQPVRDGP